MVVDIFFEDAAVLPSTDYVFDVDVVFFEEAPDGRSRDGCIS